MWSRSALLRNYRWSPHVIEHCVQRYSIFSIAHDFAENLVRHTDCVLHTSTVRLLYDSIIDFIHGLILSVLQYATPSSILPVLEQITKLPAPTELFYFVEALELCVEMNIPLILSSGSI